MQKIRNWGHCRGRFCLKIVHSLLIALLESTPSLPWEHGGPPRGPRGAPRRVRRVVAEVHVDVGVGERAAVRRVQALVDAARQAEAE